MKNAALFKEADLRRAIGATLAAGLPVSAMEVAPDGTIRVLTVGPSPTRLTREEEAERALEE